MMWCQTNIEARAWPFPPEVFHSLKQADREWIGRQMHHGITLLHHGTPNQDPAQGATAPDTAQHTLVFYRTGSERAGAGGLGENGCNCTEGCQPPDIADASS